MKKLKSYMNNYGRAVLTDTGIMIKGQQSLPADAMEASDSSNANPFADNEDRETRNSFDTSSLISCVTCLSESDSRADESSSGPLPTNTLIPYAKVLYAKEICAVSTELTPYRDEVGEQESSNAGETILSTLVEVTYARPRRHDLVPKKQLLCVGALPSGGSIVEEIMSRSYKGTKRNKTILVIMNPHGGKGHAKKLYLSKVKPILAASNCTVETVETTYHGHAKDLAKTVDADKFDIIACASGDGIPHEVLNGLFQRPDRADAFNKLIITQLPCGSGNAMSVSCHGTTNPSHAALNILKAPEIRIDLMCCSQPSYKDQPRLSFLSQTYGIIAESDVNTEFIRWMGPARFDLGVLLNILQRKKYPCEVHVKYAAKTKNELREHYTYHKSKIGRGESQETLDASNQDISESAFELKYPLSDEIPEGWETVDPTITNNLGIFYTGKMPYVAPDAKFFPAALPSDGTFDLIITDSRTSLSRMVPILLSSDKGHHVLQPEVIHSKITAFRLIPKLKHSVISVDGEKFPFEPLQVEILPGVCRTLSYDGSYVETDFDSM